MLYIVTAMYAEAAPFIKYYKLKRDRLMKRHELYMSDEKDVCLLITKPGKITAAMAVTEMLVTHEPANEDFLINIGVCGACSLNTADNTNVAEHSYSRSADTMPDTTSVFICTDILDHDTGRHYYPDMLYKHPFKEAGIETCSVVVNDKSFISMPLADMEAAAVFQAAASFFPPHRMAFLKIPSDNLETSHITKETVTGVIEENLTVICDWLNNISNLNANNSNTNIGDNVTTKYSLLDTPVIFLPSEQTLFDDLADRLNLSVTMKEQLRQLFIYRKLTKGNLDDISLPEIPEERITNQKRTILFEQFRQQFLQ